MVYGQHEPYNTLIQWGLFFRVHTTAEMNARSSNSLKVMKSESEMFCNVFLKIGAKH